MFRALLMTLALAVPLAAQAARPVHHAGQRPIPNPAVQSNAISFSGQTRAENGTLFRYSGRLVLDPSKFLAGGPFYGTPEGQVVELFINGVRENRMADAIESADGITFSIYGNPSLLIRAQGKRGRLTGDSIVTYSKANSTCSRFCEPDTYDVDGTLVLDVE